MQKENIEADNSNDDRQLMMMTWKVAVARAGQEDGEMQALENLLRSSSPLLQMIMVMIGMIMVKIVMMMIRMMWLS